VDLAILTFFCLAAQAQTPPPIVNGTPTDEWPAVGALMLCADEECALSCTATLVAADWILTAAHCAEAAQASDDARFVTGSSAQEPTRSVQLTAWHLHPDHGTRPSGGEKVPAYDVALGQLAAPIDDISPMPLNVDAVNGSWTGGELSHVGYGITADGLDDEGLKRVARIPVASYDNYNIYSLDDDGQNVCFGDSGGPVLRHQDGFGYSVAGVSSFVFAHSNSTPCVGGGSGSARIDVSLDFIRPLADVTDNEGVEHRDTGAPDTSTPDTGAPDTGEPDGGGCQGCATTAPGAVWWAWGLFVVAAQRRSRMSPS
jgi:uncharacterized protein (TIGR03382 family)